MLGGNVVWSYVFLPIFFLLNYAFGQYCFLIVELIRAIYRVSNVLRYRENDLCV